MEDKTKKGKIYWEVLIVIGALLLIEIVLGIFFTDQFGAVMSNMLYLSLIHIFPRADSAS